MPELLTREGRVFGEAVCLECYLSIQIFRSVNFTFQMNDLRGESVGYLLSEQGGRLLTSTWLRLQGTFRLPE